jgi:hypothetical protein
LYKKKLLEKGKMWSRLKTLDFLQP